MFPHLVDGDEVLVNFGAFRFVLPQVDEVVVACRPDRFEVVMVKRVTAVADTTSDPTNYILLGDNPHESTDSRNFGPVPAACILGKVTSKFG